MKYIGVYIHIPFCKKKCHYCDFISYQDKEDLIKEYIDCLNCEIKEFSKKTYKEYEEKIGELVYIKTIYIGGGTPSYINAKYISDLLDFLKNSFKYNLEEITIEINPGTITKKKLEEYKRSGINRLSIGLQSTNNKLLNQLGRIHTYEEFLETYNLARKVGFNNINIDLMIGLPNQTIEDLELSLELLSKLNPSHISIYSLIVEEKTKLEKEISKGIYILPEEELERKMYWYVKNRLEVAGYNHYEISNFAKEGFESKHNLDCWNQKEYVGFGVSAHSYINNSRYSNLENVEEYIVNCKNNTLKNNLIFHEKQDKLSKMREYMMLTLRKLEGVNINDFYNAFNVELQKVFVQELNKLKNRNLLEESDNHIKLTKQGLDLANIVWEEFI